MYIHIGEAVRECRRKKGWNATQLARYADIDRKTIYRIEATGCGNIENVEKLVGIMGYDLEIVPHTGR